MKFPRIDSIQWEEEVYEDLPQAGGVPVILLGRFLRIGCLAAAFTFAFNTSSPAQTVSPTPASAPKLPLHKIIEGWLLSDDPRLVAWGAHDALAARDKNLIPDLLNLASQWQPFVREKADGKVASLSQEQVNRRDAMEAVVDALIQMHVPVPADTVRALGHDFGNAAAVLLSRMSADESEDLSLDFYRAPTNHGYGLQYVSAVLLARQPPPGFAADLLDSIIVHAEIFVVRPGEGNFGTGGSGGSCFQENATPRKDWPTTGQYGLSEQKRGGAVLVVGGVNPVYATREQSTTYTGDMCCQVPSLYLGSNERRRLIAEMLGVSPDSIPWRTDLAPTLEFYSSEQFYFDLRRFVDEQQEQYRTTAAALESRSLLNDVEAPQSVPKLKVRITDMRGDAATPINPMADLPSNVEWCGSPWR